MNLFDRRIFGVIAIALAMIALQPYFAEADRPMEVNISHVAGKALRFGDPLPVTTFIRRPTSGEWR